MSAYKVTVEDVLHELRGDPSLRSRKARERMVQAVCRQHGVPCEARHVALLTGRRPKAPTLSPRSLKRHLVALGLEIEAKPKHSRAGNVIDISAAKRKRRSDSKESTR